MSRLKRHEHIDDYSERCFICLTECNHDQIREYSRGEGEKVPSLHICEDCEQNFKWEQGADFNEEEFFQNSADVLPVENFDKLMDWAKWERVYVFIDFTDGPTVNSVEDVADFFDALCGVLVWHPDNEFKDYVDDKGKPTFHPNDAKALDKVMERCFDIAGRQKAKDVYELGLEAMQRAGQLPKPPADSPTPPPAPQPKPEDLVKVVLQLLYEARDLIPDDVNEAAADWHKRVIESVPPPDHMAEDLNNFTIYLGMTGKQLASLVFIGKWMRNSQGAPNPDELIKYAQAEANKVFGKLPFE